MTFITLEMLMKIVNIKKYSLLDPFLHHCLQPCYKKINSTIRFSLTRRIEWYKNKIVLVNFKLYNDDDKL